MISKGKIAGLLALCSLATLTCGFSAWIVAENNPALTPDIYVKVGDVQVKGCLVSFVKGESFSMTKNGFSHEEVIQDKQYTYYDRSFLISSTWEVSSFSDISLLTYDISRDFTTEFPFFDTNYCEFTQTTYLSSSIQDKGTSIKATNEPSTFKSKTTVSLDSFKSQYETVYLTFEYQGKIKESRTTTDGKTVTIDFLEDVYDRCHIEKNGRVSDVSFHISLGVS